MSLDLLMHLCPEQERTCKDLDNWIPLISTTASETGENTPGPCAGPLHSNRGVLDGTGNVSVTAGRRSRPAIQSNRACTLLLFPLSHDENMSQRIVSWLTLGVEIWCGLSSLFRLVVASSTCSSRKVRTPTTPTDQLHLPIKCCG
jgi:hypothetical protein